ncbi:hypothetical protein FNF29_04853 [Cafeteria roenbergensis]|uniref:Methyltransferase domain-containing protein n=1 Tax=Cafeteria roenbergensis TaxID=33653 RepID=A0A5A8CCU7_CAFRO|nr:hypothetical protein FNF29_04853 [Cafeteria roenbergensis]|eukprot:KAA0150963.1 hypothetical protein FNF29_04853 [Cafeteria roenbergensis]
MQGSRTSCACLALAVAGLAVRAYGTVVQAPHVHRASADVPAHEDGGAGALPPDPGQPDSAPGFESDFVATSTLLPLVAKHFATSLVVTPRDTEREALLPPRRQAVSRWSHYWRVYEPLLEKLRHKQGAVVVEVGTFLGGSAQIWAEWFGPEVQVHAIDIHDMSRVVEPFGVRSWTADQSNASFWRDEFFPEVGHIDALIDDGGHTWAQQVVTVREALPWVKPGGVLAVEDTHSSFMSGFCGTTHESETVLGPVREAVRGALSSGMSRETVESESSPVLPTDLLAAGLGSRPAIADDPSFAAIPQHLHDRATRSSSEASRAQLRRALVNDSLTQQPCGHAAGLPVARVPRFTFLDEARSLVGDLHAAWLVPSDSSIRSFGLHFPHVPMPDVAPRLELARAARGSLLGPAWRRWFTRHISSVQFHESIVVFHRWWAPEGRLGPTAPHVHRASADVPAHEDGGAGALPPDPGQPDSAPGFESDFVATSTLLPLVAKHFATSLVVTPRDTEREALLPPRRQAVSRWSHYWRVYEPLLEKLRHKQGAVVVEVGTFLGGSAQIWAEWFGPEVQVHAIDIHDMSRVVEPFGVRSWTADQSNASFWRDEFFPEVGHIDALIDDGGHTWAQQVVTVREALPWVKPGGVLAVEDTHSSFMSGFCGTTHESETVLGPVREAVRGALSSGMGRETVESESSPVLPTDLLAAGLGSRPAIADDPSFAAIPQHLHDRATRSSSEASRAQLRRALVNDSLTQQPCGHAAGLPVARVPRFTFLDEARSLVDDLHAAWLAPHVHRASADVPAHEDGGAGALPPDPGQPDSAPGFERDFVATSTLLPLVAKHFATSLVVTPRDTEREALLPPRRQAVSRWSHYWRVYEPLLEKLRHKQGAVVVEVGTFLGGSAQIWAEWFGPEVQVHAIDIHDMSRVVEPFGVRSWTADQSNASFWRDEFFPEVGHIDALIDDGGHTWAQQVVTVREALPWVKPGGVLAVEDTHSSFMSGFCGTTHESETVLGPVREAVRGALSSGMSRETVESESSPVLPTDLLAAGLGSRPAIADDPSFAAIPQHLHDRATRSSSEASRAQLRRALVNDSLTQQPCGHAAGLPVARVPRFTFLDEARSLVGDLHAAWLEPSDELRQTVIQEAAEWQRLAAPRLELARSARGSLLGPAWRRWFTRHISSVQFHESIVLFHRWWAPEGRREPASFMAGTAMGRHRARGGITSTAGEDSPKYMAALADEEVLDSVGPHMRDLVEAVEAESLASLSGDGRRTVAEVLQSELDELRRMA